MIYPITEVKKACNERLRETFPDIRIYGNTTVDGIQRPSFFTEIFIRDYSPKSPYQSCYGYTFKATLFERVHDEIHCLQIFEQFRSAFGIALMVRKRKLVVESIEFEWIDEYADKMQITVQFAKIVEIGGRKEYGDIMRDVELEIRKEG